MEVAPRYKLLTLLTLSTMLRLATLFILFKLFFTAKTLASIPIYILLGKVRTLLWMDVWMDGWNP